MKILWSALLHRATIIRAVSNMGFQYSAEYEYE